MFLSDLVLDRQVKILPEKRLISYRIIGSMKRQNASSSFRIRIYYNDFKKIEERLPNATLERNGNMTWTVSEGEPAFKILENLFNERNSSNSYKEVSTNKVVHIEN